MNCKQEELIIQLAKEIEEKFPDVRFVEVAPSPESENTLWLEFTQPDDEDRLMALSEYASERAMDILLDYGYHFVVLPTAVNGKPVSSANSTAFWAETLLRTKHGLQARITSHACSKKPKNLSMQ